MPILTLSMIVCSWDHGNCRETLPVEKPCFLLVREGWGMVQGWRILGVFNEQLYVFIDEID